uniref:Lipoprotein n=2 Tax=Pseudoalteromonas rubra TaxID=43658 RepID=A0A0F4Q743_9GAMM|nr:hypothetical protein TW77_23880 [Pseudoalteromonas rubra]
MWRVIIILMLLSGCSAKPIDGCNFDLNHWEKTSSIPKVLSSNYKTDIDSWYKNQDGDLFYCKRFISNNVCGHEFEMHFKQANGSYQPDEVICMQ